jgi:hypothetical protein
MDWLGYPLKGGRCNNCLRDTLRDGRWNGLTCCFGERQKVKWIGLLIRWDMEGEMDWLGDTVRDGRWRGLAWRYIEKWKVKWTGLEIRWEMAGEVDWLIDLLKDASCNGLACWFVVRWQVKGVGLERSWEWNVEWSSLKVRCEVEGETNWLVVNVERCNVKCDYKYKQYVVKHNSIISLCISYIDSFNDMFRLWLWAIFRLITFLSKVKYAVSNVIVIVTYEISYNIKILTLIPLYSSIKIKWMEVNYVEYTP